MLGSGGRKAPRPLPFPEASVPTPISMLRRKNGAVLGKADKTLINQPLIMNPPKRVKQLTDDGISLVYPVL